MLDPPRLSRRGSSRMEVRGKKLRREALDHADELLGAVARVLGGDPAHLLNAVAVRRERALVDADPLETRVAELHVAVEALVLQDLVERRDDLLVDLPRCRVEAHGHERLVLAHRDQHNDRAALALASDVRLLVLGDRAVGDGAWRKVLAREDCERSVRGAHVDRAHAKLCWEGMQADERRRLRRASRRSCAGGPPPRRISSAATRVRRGGRLREDLEDRSRRVGVSHLRTRTWSREDLAGDLSWILLLRASVR